MKEHLPIEQSASFTCSAWGGTFPKDWSDEEALAEKGENFPEFQLDDCCLVCDDCYKEMGFA